MAIDAEVLVIGGGLAGLTAAIAAARDGADVRLVSHKQSTLRQASGLVDVLGYPNGETGAPVVDPFDAIADLHADHPYRILGVDAVRDGLALFDEVVADYHGSHTDANALVPTHGGTVKPTARYPASTAAGLASDDRDALFVGFHGIVDFDAPLAADHLAAAGPPFRTDGATVTFPGDVRDDARVTYYAELLDRDAEVRVDGRRFGVRRAIVERVKPHLDGHERVGFPALLGADRPTAVRTWLADELGADVFEVPMGPPSLPGVRLADQLYDALDRTGASIETGNPVVGFDGKEHVEHVLVDRNGTAVPYGADEYVLATGGLVGKGIESDRETVREPIFGCHVPHPADRYDWFEDEVFGEHAFARFGVEVGPDLRPRDERGDPEFENLRAAGSVVGGYDFPAEKSGSGVSLATGYVAGQRAAEELSEALP